MQVQLLLYAWVSYPHTWPCNEDPGGTNEDPGGTIKWEYGGAGSFIRRGLMPMLICWDMKTPAERKSRGVFIHFPGFKVIVIHQLE